MICTAKGAIPTGLTEAAQLRAILPTPAAASITTQVMNAESSQDSKGPMPVFCASESRKLPNAIARWQNFCCISYLKLNLKH
jgi:hypothetical protein